MTYDSKEQKALVLAALDGVSVAGKSAEEFVKLKQQLMAGEIVPLTSKDKKDE